MYVLLSFTQAKRRLELEAGDPQDLQDGGGAATAKKPMAALPHTGEKGKILYCSGLQGFSITNIPALGKRSGRQQPVLLQFFVSNCQN